MAVKRLTRDASKALTRDRLLAAAEQLFVRDGFHATALDAVAEQAGYTKGAVYSAFEGKADLFLAVFDTIVDRRLAELAALFEHSESPRARLAELAARPIEQRNRRTFLLAIEFWLHAEGDPALQRRFAAHYERLRAGIERLAPDPAPAGGLSRQDWATVTLALANGLALERLIDAGAVSVDLMAHTLGLLAGVAEAPPET